MREEKKRFVLYEYLMYFWKRKHYFLIVPIITMLLIGGAVYFLKKDMPYTGQALVYTGSITSPDLTRQNNIEATFEDEKNLEIVVTSKQVKFVLKGDNKKDIANRLDKITETYRGMLVKHFDERFQTSDVYVQSLNKRVSVLEKAIESYKQELEKGLDPDQYEDVTALIIETEKELTDAAATLNRMSSDLLFYQKEKPRVLTETVTPSKNYLKEGAAIGLILGLVLTVALLALLKYLSEGRRYYND
ncbi:hypothetical protein BK139_06610 [Paenibacillus sp. FSL R5-0490]|uniref:hypothetical protein n=1 Tax=Bacillales TaxID=1385 RepID=UPI00096CF0F3|nr:hypothetical protein [Paenibacillus sp. FSL R5-0490]OMF61508.1 hypothetical protein BK139_06610 [Paenibacillus sp. FSL R5-0490]